ncbi:MAG TPA: hypothetical protein VJK72_05000 [Candidatus Nanoarchaeia archaeon]|nr:hypothetical protein [Candidatus Nanoarchaeia archaeon]
MGKTSSKRLSTSDRKLYFASQRRHTLGKPLGYPFFREKKIDKYRVYFLVYEDVTTVLLITISDKKAQQQTIDNIKSQLDFYKELIKKKINAL